MREALVVFAVVLAAYLRTMPASLAPWRDAGEMCAASWTLGVAHPTSYPLYILLGRAMRLFPLGNFAYRLNLLSAVAGAAAAALIAFWARGRRGSAAALAGAAWLALNPAFWAVSQVSEMYSLWVLSAAVLMILAQESGEDASERLWPGFCFLAGLLLGNRLDLLLWAPGLLWLALRRRPLAAGEDGLWGAAALLAVPAAVALSGSKTPMALLVIGTLLLRSRAEGFWRRAGTASIAGLAGLSVYLFLPVRSASAPFLDWNHPALFSNFLDSLLRTRYGGTLDLISRRYAIGELFFDNMRLWGAHLWDAFGPAGLAAAVAGAAYGFLQDRGRWLGRAACWWWSGPVFLFLANLPPNPHAAAIVEPHYLLSDAVLVFWAVDGVGLLAFPRPALAWAMAAAAVAWPLWRGVPARMDRRSDFALADFVSNVLGAAPPDSVVVAKKDVQLYALWHAQTVEGRRPDLRIVAQGLAGTAWYQADWRRRDSGLVVTSLAAPEGWRFLAAGGRRVLATQDAELPAAVAAQTRSRGLLTAVLSPEDEGLSWELMVRRDRRRYGETPDFFASDLIESWAEASYRRGLELEKSGRVAEAKKAITEAWSRHWLFPEAPLMLGYMAAVSRDWAAAYAEYALADELFGEKLRLALRYRSLPELVAGLRRQAAEAATHRGVAAERLGRPEEAAGCYRRALALSPLAQTHYNLAALAWGKDRGAAEEHLLEALRLDPSHAEARKYLSALGARPVNIR